VNHLLKVDVRNCKSPETLYFLCKRDSGSFRGNKERNDEYFEKLTKSIAQSQRYIMTICIYFSIFFFFHKMQLHSFSFFSFYRNVGRFGGTNQPGYPRPWRVAGKFASQASARSPLLSTDASFPVRPDI
jgi:hypothetical protein